MSSPGRADPGRLTCAQRRRNDPQCYALLKRAFEHAAVGSIHFITQIKAKRDRGVVQHSRIAKLPKKRRSCDETHKVELFAPGDSLPTGVWTTFVAGARKR